MVAPNAARPALLAAFADAMMRERFSQLRVGAICAAAGVGRTTFYLHFRTLDDLLMAVVGPMIEALADGLTAPTPPAAARAVLEHIWTQRRQGELWRDANFRSLFADALARRLEATTENPAAAPFIGAGVAETLHRWTAGRLRVQPAALLDLLRQLSLTLRPPPAFPA